MLERRVRSSSCFPLWHYSLTGVHPRKTREFTTTLKDEKDIAAAANEGGSRKPVKGNIMPIANGMPELHGLTPILSVLQDRGIKVALITDGRMSGASGKVPAAIHLSPEASSSGPISKIKNGDLIRLDALSGELNNLEKNFESREVRKKDLTKNESGLGRELFKVFRENAKSAKYGGGIT